MAGELVVLLVSDLGVEALLFIGSVVDDADGLTIGLQEAVGSLHFVPVAVLILVSVDVVLVIGDLPAVMVLGMSLEVDGLRFAVLALPVDVGRGFLVVIAPAATATLRERRASHYQHYDHNKYLHVEVTKEGYKTLLLIR